MIFVRVLKTAETWEDEAAILKKLMEGGVSVVPGKHYGGIDGQKGWIRMLFAVREDVMREAIGGVDGVSANS